VNKQFTKQQDIGFLKELYLKKHGVCKASYYRQRSKFGGMGVQKAK